MNPRPLDLPTSELPSQVDVAIVGGGYTGLNAARMMAQDGASVAVLERQIIGAGASARNGGIVATGMKQSFQTIHKQYGGKMARQLWDATMDGIDLIGELVADENIMCHFLRKGHITLAVKPSHFEKMQKKVTWYKRVLNHDLHVLSQKGLQTEIGSSAFYGGLVDEWSASLDPAKYLFGLAQVVARCGGAAV